MAVVFSRDEVDVKRTTVSTAVADNDIAKLMYYLGCVCTSIDCNQDEEIRRFINYANWVRLSTDEHKLLLLLCSTFSPDVFEGKVFFHSEEFCIHFSNEFYKINQVRDRLVAVQSIIVAGRTRQVTKVMTYKMAWMQTNYIEPMRRLASKYRIETPSQRKLPTSQSSRLVPTPAGDSGCCCAIL